MIRNIFINFSARLATQAMFFVVLLITTHYMGSEVRGEISLIQLSITMVHLVSDIVGGPALVYMVPRSNLRVLIITGWIWATFSTVVIGGLFVYFNVIPQENMVPVLIASFLLSIGSINNHILLGQERIKLYNIMLVLQGVLMLSVMATSVILLNSQHVEPYLHACYVAYGACFLLGLYFVTNHKHVPTMHESRPLLFVLFTTGLFNQLATISFQWSIRLNYIALMKLGNTESLKSVGIYSTAISLGDAILLFSTSVASVMMARISNEGNTEVSRIRTIRLSKLSIGVTLPAVILFALLPPAFYEILLGPQFGGVRDSFVTIAPGIILLSFGTVYGHYFSGTGRQYMNFFGGLFAITVTSITVVFLAGNYGIFGAGISASLAYSGLALFIFMLFMLTGRSKAEWKELLPSVNDFRMLRQIGSTKETDETTK